MAAAPPKILDSLWALARQAGENLADLPRQVQNYPADLRSLANDPERLREAATTGALAFGPGIMAGKSAIGAPLARLTDAQKLETLGTSRENIWQMTGWFKDVDGGWKYEINDAKSQLRDRTGAETARTARGGDPLGPFQARDVLDHPETWKAYPGLSRAPVIFSPGRESSAMTAGAYSRPNSGWGMSEGISLQPGGNSTDLGIHSTLLHELNHGVQFREGFARGGSPQEFLPQDFQTQVKQVNDFLNSHDGLFESAGIDQGALEAGLRKLRTGGAPSDLTWHESNAVQNYMTLSPEITRPYNQSLVKADELQAQSTAAHEQYNNLAGEVSSRNVQERFEQNDYQRAPWQTTGYPQGPQLVRQQPKEFPRGNLQMSPGSHMLESVEHDPWQHQATPIDHDPFDAGAAAPSPGPELVQAAKDGKAGDSLLGHLTPGDTVFSAEKLARHPELRTELDTLAARYGIDLSRFTAGGPAPSLNPTTGLQQFEDVGGEGSSGDSGGGGDFGGAGDSGDSSGGGSDVSGPAASGDSIGNPDAAAVEAAQASGVSGLEQSSSAGNSIGNPDAAVVEQQQAAGNTSLAQAGPATIGGSYGLGVAGQLGLSALGFGLGLPGLSTVANTGLQVSQANADLARFGAADLTGRQVASGALNNATSIPGGSLVGLGGGLLGTSINDSAVNNAASALGVGLPGQGQGQSTQGSAQGQTGLASGLAGTPATPGGPASGLAGNLGTLPEFSSYLGLPDTVPQGIYGDRV